MSDSYVPARNPAPGQQRGQLRVDTDISQQGSVDRAGLSGGLSAFASAFAQSGAKIGAIADHAAAKEGTEAGRAAGIDPEFRPTRSLTIRGEAYDQAGLEIYGARTKTAFAADLDAAYDAHKGDPQALSAALEAKRNSWVGESLEEVRPELELMYEKSRFAYLRQAAREQQARITAEHKASLETELTQTLKEGQQRAYALGLDASADEVLGSDLAAIERTLRRRGIDGTPFFTPDQIQNTLAKAQGEMTDARLIGAFDRTDGLEAKAAFIEKFKADFASSEGLAAEYDFDGFEAITGKMETSLSKEVTARKTAVRAAAEDVKSLTRRAEKGFAAPPDELAAIEAKVATAADPETSAAFAEVKSLLTLQETARTWTPAQMDQAIAATRTAMEKDGASDAQVNRLTLLESLETEMRTQLKQDPNGWADRVGLIELAPIDLSSAESAGGTIKARIAQAEEVGDRYGQETTYLRPDEKRQIATLAAQGGEQTLMIASAISGAADDRTPRIMAELFDEAPAVAMIGGLVAEVGPNKAARDAADGLALMKTEGFQALAPSKVQAREVAVTHLGDALANMPKSETAAITLANAIYEVRARRQAVSEFDGELWRQSLSEALGEQTIGGETFGGIVENDLSGWSSERRIVLPPFVNREHWREAIDMITPQDLLLSGLGQPVGDDGVPVSIERLRNATFVQWGNGEYLVATGDPSTPGAEGYLRTLGPVGLTDFVLDLKTLGPRLAKRRPDLFLGGPAPIARPRNPDMVSP